MFYYTGKVYSESFCFPASLAARDRVVLRTCNGSMVVWYFVHSRKLVVNSYLTAHKHHMVWSPCSSDDVDVTGGILAIETAMDMMNKNMYTEAIEMLKPRCNSQT